MDDLIAKIWKGEVDRIELLAFVLDTETQITQRECAMLLFMVYAKIIDDEEISTLIRVRFNGWAKEDLFFYSRNTDIIPINIYEIGVNIQENPGDPTDSDWYNSCTKAWNSGGSLDVWALRDDPEAMKSLVKTK